MCKVMPPDNREHPATLDCVVHAVECGEGAICAICLHHVGVANPVRTGADDEPTLASVCIPCERALRARGLFRRDAIDALIAQSYAWMRRAQRLSLLRSLEVEEGRVM